MAKRPTGKRSTVGRIPADVPQFRLEPPIQLFTDFKKVQQVRDVVRLLDLGYFQFAAFLIEQMLWNPRLAGVMETRLNGLMGTAIRWEASRPNDAARRAQKAIVEDWPLIADEATRKQLHLWGLLLGTGFAQKHWYVSQLTGRQIPKLQVYHPSWVIWNWGPRLYQIMTMNGMQWVRSPALTVPGEEIWTPQLDVVASGHPVASPLQWVVHEPFGQHSWRRGLIHPAWSPWLAHEYSRRDMARASEKLGLAAIALEYPKIEGDSAALKILQRALRNLSSEGIIPLEQRDEGEKGFKVEPFEYGGTGYDMIDRTKQSNAIDLSVLLLGHNLTSEAKGGSYAAANVGDLIRGDIKAFDAASESATFRQQVVSDWAELNFGDRELAPIAIYETDPPAINLAAAQTLQFVAAALGVLPEWVDKEGLLLRFRVPIKPGGAKAWPAAPAPATSPSSPPQKSDAMARLETSIALAKQGNQEAVLAAVVEYVETQKRAA